MSILRPINYAGAWEFRSPVPVPSGGILDSPQVSIEFNETWIPAVMSALKALTRPEAYYGILADINRATQDAHNLFDAKSGGTMPIGSILPHMLSVLPGNWLACDGSTHLRVDYPALYAAIDAAYIIDADHFKVPDLMGRVAIGAGSGSGLTSRAVNAQGGEETHTMIPSELPVHSHGETWADTSGVVHNAEKPTSVGNLTTAKMLSVFDQSCNSKDTLLSSAFGGAAIHNNMQPFTAVKFAVVAR